MKRILVLFLLFAMLMLTSCEAIGGILPLGKTNTARFTAHYDYGFHNNGKASLLLDGATVFFDPEEWGIDRINAGDVIVMEYRGGELLIQESYPATVVTKDVEIINISIEKAKIIELTVMENPGGGFSLSERDNSINITSYAFPNLYVISEDMTYRSLDESPVGKTLYGTITESDDGITLEALYDFSPN